MRLIKLLRGSIIPAIGLLMFTSCGKDAQNPPPKITIYYPANYYIYHYKHNLPVAFEVYDADGLKDVSMEFRGSSKPVTRYAVHPDVTDSNTYIYSHVFTVDSFYGVQTFNGVQRFDYDMVVIAHDKLDNERQVSVHVVTEKP